MLLKQIILTQMVITDFHNVLLHVFSDVSTLYNKRMIRIKMERHQENICKCEVVEADHCSEDNICIRLRCEMVI